MNNIDNQNSYYLPNSLDGLNNVYDTVTNTALLVDGTNMMMADINMNYHTIKNLDPGIAFNEAVNVAQLDLKASVAYVDARDALKVSKIGDTMTGSLAMSNNKITGLGNAINANDAVNKLQLDLKVNKSGDTMTGPLAMSNNKITNLATGINAQDAINKSQLDTKLTKAGDAMTGTLSMTSNKITNLSDGTTSNDAINKSQLDTKVSKSGDTMTGALAMSNNKITNLGAGANITDAVNYQQLSLKAPTTYVDSQDNLRLLKAGDTMTGGLAMSFNKITNLGNGTNPNDAVNKSQLDLKADTTYVNTQDNLRVLKTGDTMTGALAMTNNKITGLLAGTNPNDAVNKSQLDLKADTTYVNSQDNLRALDTAVVHNTGDETVAGTKSFTSRTVISPNSGQSASAHLELNNGNLVWMRMFTNLSGGNYNSAVSAGDCAILTTQNNPANTPPTGVLFIGPHDGTGASGFKIAPTQNTSYKPLSLNTTNKIINMADGTNPNDAVNKSQLDLKSDITYVNTQDNLRLLKAGDTMTGALSMNTTNKITNLANGTNANDAINKNQLDNEFSSRERTRPQAQYCKAWRKVGGVDTSINVMGVGWSVGLHQDSVSPGSQWGLEHTAVNDGVFVRVDVPLYKGDVVNGFFFGCKAPDDNGSVVKIFVYGFNDNKVATTEASTCANQYVVYCPFTTAWTVPSTQTYRVCIVWQSGGVNHILSTISGWISFFNNMATAYNNTYINQTNKTPPDFYDLVDVPLTRNSIVYAYRTI
jgi:hypothetical protein